MWTTVDRAFTPTLAAAARAGLTAQQRHARFERIAITDFAADAGHAAALRNAPVLNTSTVSPSSYNLRSICMRRASGM